MGLGIVLVVVGAPFWALASLTQSPTNHLLFSVPMCQSNTTASTWVGVDLINTEQCDMSFGPTDSTPVSFSIPHKYLNSGGHALVPWILRPQLPHSLNMTLQI